MSRKAGTPNKPKVIIVEAVGVTDEDVENGKALIENFAKTIVATSETKDIISPKYRVEYSHSIEGLETLVSMFLSDYVCQGGVSVTNYRALDGSITMVYCQAMIRKDML